MAQRDLNFDPTVTNVVAEQPDNTLMGLFNGAAKIADASENSKMLSASADAQLQFKKLDAEYRIKYEADPLNPEGLQELAEARKAISEQLGSNLSIYHQRDWQDKTTQLAASSDLSNEIWGVAQQKDNAEYNLNESMMKFLAMGSRDGEAFGKTVHSDGSPFLNYANAAKELEQFGNQNLGEMTTKKLLKDFNTDYMKSMISGVAQTNPNKALRLLKDPQVEKAFENDPESLAKFRKAVGNRAEHMNYNNQQSGIIDQMRRDAIPLADGGKMTYAQLNSTNLSETAKEYYSNLNGFSKGSGKRGGFNDEDKLNYKMAIFGSVEKLMKDPDMDAQSVYVVQDAVIKGMNKDAISQADGAKYLKQLVEPLIAKKENAMSKFSKNSWFADDIGFGGIQEYYDKEVYKDTSGLTADTRRVVEVQNMNSKANLYDYYMGSLTGAANQLGIPVANIPDLPASQRKAIYASSQTKAQQLFLQDKHPGLRTLPDTPNVIYGTDGTLVQGLAGPRNVKSAANVTPTFKVQQNKKTGELRRVYQDGTIEVLK